MVHLCICDMDSGPVLPQEELVEAFRFLESLPGYSKNANDLPNTFFLLSQNLELVHKMTCL